MFMSNINRMMVLGAYFFFVKDMSTLIEIQIKVFLFRIKPLLLILIYFFYKGIFDIQNQRESWN